VVASTSFAQQVCERIGGSDRQRTPLKLLQKLFGPEWTQALFDSCLLGSGNVCGTFYGVTEVASATSEMLDEALCLVPSGTLIGSNDGIDIVVDRDTNCAWMIDYLDGRCRRLLMARSSEEFFSILVSLLIAWDHRADPDSWNRFTEATPPDVTESWSYYSTWFDS
jgi:hypothetical protein